MKTLNSISNYRLVFRKWSRKNYAVFASLKQEVHIGHLSFSICASLVSRGKSLISFESRRFGIALDEIESGIAERLRLSNMALYLPVLALVSLTEKRINYKLYR
jgi:hypothetical protein